jgi:hypothetical protein
MHGFDRFGTRVRAPALAALAALVLAAPPALATQLRASVLGNGAIPSTQIQAGPHRLFGTAGQAIVGVSEDALYLLCHGYWCTGAASVVGVDPPPTPGADLPRELSFGVPAPNPSAGAVTFALGLPRAGRVDLTVYDVQGRTIGQPVARRLDPGRHALRWAPSGATPAGVYFARLSVDGRFVAQRRVVVLR